MCECASILCRAHGSVSGTQKSFILGFFFFIFFFIFLFETKSLTLPAQAGWPIRESLRSNWPYLPCTGISSACHKAWLLIGILGIEQHPSSWAGGSHLFISLLFSTEITTANKNDIDSNTTFVMPLKCGHILRCLQNKWLNQEYYQRTIHNTKNLCKERKLCLEWCSEQAFQ